MHERYHDQLVRVICYIEKSLDRAISLDDLSREACLSKFHLHHVFRAMTGYPLAEYIRRRRLSESLVPLMTSKASVLEIALNYGFTHEQSYGRAFKALYGMSPGYCRRLQPVLPLTDAVNFSAVVAIGNDGALLPARYVFKSETIICGRRHWIDRSINRKESTVTQHARTFFATDRKRVTDPAYHDRFIGLSFSPWDGNAHDYITGIELRAAPKGTAPEGLEYYPLPSARYREFVEVMRVHPSRITYNDLQILYERIRRETTSLPFPTDPLRCKIEYIDMSTAREDFSEFRVLIPE